MWWVVLLALVVCVGATNIYNFMDGINGITGGYSLAILIPLLLMNGGTGVAGEHAEPFIDGSFLVVAILSVLLFCIGKLVLAKADVTWLLMLIVYGVDGCLTIVHRIMLHEPLGEAHRNRWSSEPRAKLVWAMASRDRGNRKVTTPTS